MARTRRRMNRSSKAKTNKNMNAAVANILSRLRLTNKSIAAAIGGRRTRKQRGKIPKSVAMRAIKANRRVASAAAAAAIGGRRW
jgi:hypothetical protein